jgi:hypothetical protein
VPVPTWWSVQKNPRTGPCCRYPSPCSVPKRYQIYYCAGCGKTSDADRIRARRPARRAGHRPGVPLSDVPPSGVAVGRSRRASAGPLPPASASSDARRDLRPVLNFIDLSDGETERAIAREGNDCSWPCIAFPTTCHNAPRRSLAAIEAYRLRATRLSRCIQKQTFVGLASTNTVRTPDHVRS